MAVDASFIFPVYQEFKIKTSVLRDGFSAGYGKKWQAVHSSYAAYIDAPGDLTGSALLACLHLYLEEHGRGSGRFEDLERNRGNFLKDIYDNLNARHNPDHAKELVQTSLARAALEDLDGPHTRAGVLYALSSIEIDGNFNLSATFLGALSQSGNLAGQALGADLSRMDTADNARYEVEMEAYGHTVDVDSREFTDASHAFGNAVELMMQKIGLGKSVKRKFATSGVKPLLPAFQYPMTRAAIESLGAGLSETYNQTDYFSAEFLAGVPMRGLETAGKAAGVVLKAGMETAHYVSAAAMNFFTMMYKKIEEYIASLVRQLREDRRYRFDFSISFSSAILKIALKQVMGTAVPFIGNAINLTEKGILAFSEITRAITLSIAQWSVKMMPGHPELIAKYIRESHLTNALQYGCQAIQSAALVAVDATVPGVGSLVSAIAGACQWIYGVVEQYFRVEQLNQFVLQARGHWEDQVAHATTPRSVFASEYTPLLSDVEKFSAWFQEGCIGNVLIPAIVLRSGMAGSWMSWCELISPEGGRVSDRAFERGVDFVESLKADALSIIRSSNIKILPATKAASPTDTAAIAANRNKEVMVAAINGNTFNFGSFETPGSTIFSKVDSNYL